jgi:hypothetical protein
MTRDRQHTRRVHRDPARTRRGLLYRRWGDRRRILFVHSIALDLACAIEAPAAGDDLSWTRIHTRGHRPFSGPPSGRPADGTVIGICGRAAGRITKH